MIYLVLALSGGLGAATRFVVDGVVRERAPGPFPLGTMTVNVAGSLLLGLVTGWAIGGPVGNGALLVIVAGFTGGFTTFSTAMVDAVRLVHTGHLRLAAISLFGTLIAAVGAVLLGLAVGIALGSVSAG